MPVVSTTVPEASMPEAATMAMVASKPETAMSVVTVVMAKSERDEWNAIAVPIVAAVVTMMPVVMPAKVNLLHGAAAVSSVLRQGTRR